MDNQNYIFHMAFSNKKELISNISIIHLIMSNFSSIIETEEFVIIIMGG